VQLAKNIKLGIHEDARNCPKLVKLIRFYSTQSLEELSNFDEYIERMKEGQNGIYWIISESKDAVISSPMLEYFRQKGIEVLFLTDLMDEYAFQQLKDYPDHKLICITKENCELGETEDEKKAFEDLKTKFERSCKKIKDFSGKIARRSLCRSVCRSLRA
jgi:molecular chaperone HtpG